MKNIKDITLSIFAIIGFLTILSSFNNQTQQTHSTVPESHVWELNVGANGNGEGRAYLYNKITGEVRKYSRTFPSFKGVPGRGEAQAFIVMKHIDEMVK